MCVLGVDTVGLRMLAAHCRSWAAELGMASAPDSSGMPCQATSAAVSAVHAGVGTAGRALASRMESAAANLIAAGVDYFGTDQRSAAHIHNLATAL
jgi:hypothetical protein